MSSSSSNDDQSISQFEWTGSFRNRFRSAEDQFRSIQNDILREKSSLIESSRNKRSKSNKRLFVSEAQQDDDDNDEDTGYSRTRKRASLISTTSTNSFLPKQIDKDGWILENGIWEKSKRRNIRIQRDKIGQIFLHNDRQNLTISSDFEGNQKPVEIKKVRRKGSLSSKKTANSSEDEESDDVEENNKVIENDEIAKEKELEERKKRKGKTEVEIEEMCLNMPDSSLLSFLQNFSSQFYDSNQMLNHSRVPPSNPSVNDNSDKEAEEQIKFGMLHSCEGNALIALGVFTEELIKWEANSSKRSKRKQEQQQDYDVSNQSSSTTSTRLENSAYQRLIELRRKEKGLKIKEGMRKAEER